MLLANRLAPYARGCFWRCRGFRDRFICKQIAAMDVAQYRDQRLVIKGCGDVPVPVSAYVELNKKLTPVAKSLMFGEPCSTVPIYKRAIKPWCTLRSIGFYINK
jgi:hypothetical protein